MMSGHGVIIEAQLAQILGTNGKTYCGFNASTYFTVFNVTHALSLFRWISSCSCFLSYDFTFETPHNQFSRIYFFFFLLLLFRHPCCCSMEHKNPVFNRKKNGIRQNGRERKKTNNIDTCTQEPKKESHHYQSIFNFQITFDAVQSLLPKTILNQYLARETFIDRYTCQTPSFQAFAWLTSILKLLLCQFFLVLRTFFLYIVFCKCRFFCVWWFRWSKLKI